MLAASSALSSQRLGVKGLLQRSAAERWEGTSETGSHCCQSPDTGPHFELQREAGRPLKPHLNGGPACVRSMPGDLYDLIRALEDVACLRLLPP